jgi:hypothetical protein
MAGMAGSPSGRGMPAVRSFVESACRAVEAGHPAVLRSEVLRGKRKRRGILLRPDGEWRYAVHGTGCRYHTPEGIEVDLDIDLEADCIPVFDVWRIRQHAASTGMEPGEDDEISAACAEFVLRGVLVRNGPHEFGLPEYCHRF